MEKNKMRLWVKETHQDMVSLGFKVEKTLFSGQSPFQQVDILQTKGHGIMLLNDGMIMLSEKDEFIYHEMIAHVPLFIHPRPERVLIIGGGDGGSAREVLKHKNIKQVTMVEIDEMVVNACRAHIPSVSHAMDDPRLKILIEDGVKYVSETKNHFDVIIVDSTDPVGPAEPLFNKVFYQSVASILTDEGILISQAESPFYNQAIQYSMLSNQRTFFNKLHMYLFPTLTYPGGLWSFSFSSKGLSPIYNFEPMRLKSSGILTRYYSEKIHVAAFALPPFLKEKLRGLLDSV